MAADDAAGRERRTIESTPRSRTWPATVVPAVRHLESRERLGRMRRRNRSTGSGSVACRLR